MATDHRISVGRLRLGVFAAARNVPYTVLQPIEMNPDLASRIQVVGLACQTYDEASEFCKAWKIPKAYGSLEEMLEDPQVDAVYNVLPAPMRCTWTVRALLAGKHVLSETPVCVNAREAVAIQRAAEDSCRVMLEGCHPACHPVTKRVHEMILSGAVGSLESIEMTLPISHSVMGQVLCKKMGALMGIGIHAVSIIRVLSQGEPSVISAEAVVDEENEGVDAQIACELALPYGGTARFKCSADTESKSSTPTTYEINGSSGTIQVSEWFAGKGRAANEITLEQFSGEGHKSVEVVNNRNPETRDTFYYQLIAFCNEVSHQSGSEATGMPWKYSTHNSPGGTVRNMSLVDSIARTAGMMPRRSSLPPPAPYDVIGRSKL